MELKKYQHKDYTISWNPEEKIIYVKFLETFSKESAKDFKRDALELGMTVKGMEKTVKVLHDLREVSDDYDHLDVSGEMLLVDAMEYVDKIASFGLGRAIRKSSLGVFDTVHFLTQGKEMRFYEDENSAKSWLMKQ
ncbi:MAG: hypothetical protein IPN70_04210 [Candidatus Moraniibacteriota bacterium]|nr:MAG: hypothetical protein IPN70_04210 [Candidatus Moranbacteria bacterium]